VNFDDWNEIIEWTDCEGVRAHTGRFSGIVASNCAIAARASGTRARGGRRLKGTADR
jgi:hypothetical protein